MLTGPSAAALYGSDAANGVVVINTKRGVKDRTVVTVSNSTTFSKVYRLPDMQNSYGTSSGLMNWGEKYASTFDAKKFFNTGTNIINSVSVSTGNEKNQTYISASTTNTAGIIPENTYDRYNFTARQYHLVRQGQARTGLGRQLYHPARRKHGDAGQVLQPAARALPLPAQRRLRRNPPFRALGPRARLYGAVLPYARARIRCRTPIGFRTA